MSQNETTYEEIEIEFSIKDITLSGTLTIPKKERNPCTILLSGYGSVTRDNPSRNFPRYKVLAEELVRKGIASLRFDDRGSGKSTKVNWHDYTFDDLADEALAAVKFVKEILNIDSEKIGFIGHSLGATIGPLAASKSKEIAFISSLAPHGLIGVETAINSRNAMSKGLGESSEEITRWSKRLREILRELRDQKTKKNPLTNLKQLMEERYEKLQAEFKNNFQTFESFIGSTYEGALLQLGETSMYKSFLAFNPQEMYEQLNCPIQLMFAGNDSMHPIEIHKNPIKIALSKTNIDVKIVDFPDANHNFTTIENQVTTGFVAGFCECISDWIRNLFDE